MCGRGGGEKHGCEKRTTPTLLFRPFLTLHPPTHTTTQGGFQYWLYNIQFTKMCAPLTARFGHRGVAPVKVFLDQAIHHPLLYFPFFYGLKAFVEGKPLASAATKYKAEAWESCQALWKVWVPAQLVNFAFVPRHLRIPYVAAVSFGWTVILSTMQGRFDARDREAAAAGGGRGRRRHGARAAVHVDAAPAQQERGRRGCRVRAASTWAQRRGGGAWAAAGGRDRGGVARGSRGACRGVRGGGGGAMPPQ